MVAHNFSTLEVIAGGSGIQEQLWWYNDFEVNLGYREPALRIFKEHKAISVMNVEKEEPLHRDTDQYSHYGRQQEDFSNK